MEYDVIIVGGGPAGSTAATVLAEHKCKILVVDKHTFPREKPCGGGLSTRVWKHFPYVEQYLDSICYGAITHSSTRKYSFTINREKPMLGMVRRSVFDKHLLDYAEQTGAEVRFGAEVIDVQRNNTGVDVQLNTDETLSAPLILGCDGMRSIVAEKTGLNKKIV